MSKSVTRRAAHAGSWYLDDAAKLDRQLDEFLSNVPATLFEHGPVPVPRARIIISPHAGYSYSGPTAAWAYKAWDVSNLDRVFLLGPSHHMYLSTCALSQCTEYATPLGNIPIDTETVGELFETGQFQKMSRSVDEAEHSLEMQLPYIYKILSESKDGMRPLVPIMVGALSKSGEQEFGELLAPFLANPRNGFVISTDFCHWGKRFSYTNYVDDPSCTHVRALRGRSDAISSEVPIYRSIEILDYKGMDVSNGGSHAEWTEYLAHTKNTICGRHPLGVLIAGVEYLRTTGVELPYEHRKPAAGTGPAQVVAEQHLTGEDALKYQFGKIYWVQYRQSSRCKTVDDSSVSYAAGFAKA